MNLESIISNPFVIAFLFYMIGHWQGKRYDDAIVDTVNTLKKDVWKLDDKINSLMVKTGLDDIDWKLNEWVEEETVSKNE